MHFRDEHKIVAIVQARMGSTRLPGKVLKNIQGKSLLEILIERIRISKFLSEIVVATTLNQADDAIVNHCIEKGIKVFRGMENDVLNRYYECAKEYNADIIVRVTSDCPLVDFSVLDSVIELFYRTESEYSANTIPSSTSKFPDGSDVEVFSMEVLKYANDYAVKPEDREHVTFFFWQNNGVRIFKTSQINHHRDLSQYRFTIDYPEDFEVVSKIMYELKKENKFGHLDQVVKILDDNPEIRNLNSKYYFGIGWEK